MTGYFTTGEQSTEGRRIIAFGARPLVDGGSATVALKHRNLLSESITTDTAISPNSVDGEAKLRKNARYLSFRVTAAGAWQRAYGLEVRAVDGGNR